MRPSLVTVSAQAGQSLRKVTWIDPCAVANLTLLAWSAEATPPLSNGVRIGKRRRCLRTPHLKVLSTSDPSRA